MRTALRVKFPDQQGKYREFLRFLPRFGQLSAEKAAYRLGFIGKFPTQPNRELFSPNRESFLPIREFSGRSREIHPRQQSVQRCSSGVVEFLRCVTTIPGLTAVGVGLGVALANHPALKVRRISLRPTQCERATLRRVHRLALHPLASRKRPAVVCRAPFRCVSSSGLSKPLVCAFAICFSLGPRFERAQPTRDVLEFIPQNS